MLLGFNQFNPLETYAGNVFWVRSGQSDSNPGTYNKPFATLDYAIGRCTANNGDQIHIKAGHTENISAASGIDFDVAGITVIGHGINQQRPTFTWTAATATMVVDVANTVLYNLSFAANAQDVAEMVDVGAVSGFQIHNCKIEDLAANTNYLEIISLASGASEFHMTNCLTIGLDTDNNSVVQAEGAIDGFHVEDCIFIEGVAKGGIIATLDASGALTAMNISNNYYISEETDVALIAVDTSGASTNDGVCVNNFVGCQDTGWTADQLAIDVTGALQFNTTMVGGNDVQGTHNLPMPSREAAT